MNQLLDTSLAGGTFLLGLYLLAGVVVLVLLLRRYRLRSGVFMVGAVGFGAAFGWMLAWLISDVWDVFGISFSTITRLWVMALFASLAVVVASLIRTRPWRKVVAIISIPLCLIAAAAGINADFGEYPTVGTALGLENFSSLAAAESSTTNLNRGVVGTVTIPATVSHFNARQAVVYLPPAARTAHPPVLPVIVMLSGQPGGPADIFTSGRMATFLDAYAAAHHGIAPIVVVPDQLGGPTKNPMCVDGALGNSATYLTVDVPTWIRAHFAVAASPDGWAIGGFSQGGTCSIQLGAAHPELFRTILDISGELAPRMGTIANTITTGFAGSKAAYNAAVPATILASNAPYSDLDVIFAVGGNDTRYQPWTKAVSDAASRAGATTQVIVSPGTAHDWHTVQYALEKAVPIIASRIELSLTP